MVLLVIYRNPMKKTFFFLVLLVAVHANAVAKKIEGTIIFENGVERTVTFKIPFRLLSGHADYERLQHRVRFFDKGKELVLKPGEASEFRFSYQNETVRMVSIRHSGLEGLFSGDNAIFLKLEMDGHLRLYRLYETRVSGGYDSSHPHQTEEYYLQKKGGALKRLKAFSFRKDMADYLSDCPSVADKIKDKDFKRRDLEVIVIAYNKDCN